MTAARGWHAAVALLAIVGLVIEYHMTLAGHPGRIAERTLVYVSFYTTLTNMLVAAMAAGSVLGWKWALDPSLRTATAVHITVVAVIFRLLLARLLHFAGIGWWGNMLVHELVPALWLVGWIVFRPPGTVSALAPLRWMLYPLVYGVWTLIHGAASGWYPYPFLDVARWGYGRVAVNMLAMAAFFAALGYAFRWIDGRNTSLRAPA